MKCPNCGAEISNAKYCEFCGSQITADMQKEQEQLNKTGCPKCGSTNIKFTREKQGEARGKKGTQIIRVTTGVCNDCGYTWQTQDAPKKKKTWLWVLGWLFIFPLPLTIILLRKKDMNNILKYGIIAVAWIVYLVIGFAGGGSDTDSNNIATEVTTNTTITSSADSAEEAQSAASFELVAGEAGEYGKEITMSEDEGAIIVYYVPAGKYIVKNLGDYMTQVNVYSAIQNKDTGYYEYSEDEKPIIVRLDVNGADEIEVPDGWFIEIHEPTHISLTAK